MRFASHSVPPLLAAACQLFAAASAHAAMASRFDCSGPGISILLTLDPDTGTAKLLSPRGTDELSLESAGIWRDDTQDLQFFADEMPATLWMGPEQFTCRALPDGN
ncbi:MAG: hypothetical protein H6887_02270 [Hoeflea sp.]|nr:hypothetical protein [Hoeflea sp.]